MQSLICLWVTSFSHICLPRYTHDTSRLDTVFKNIKEDERLFRTTGSTFFWGSSTLQKRKLSRLHVVRNIWSQVRMGQLESERKEVKSLNISELSKYAQMHLRPFFLLLLTNRTARPNLLTMQSWQSSNISPRIFGVLLLARVPNPLPKPSESSWNLTRASPFF